MERETEVSKRRSSAYRPAESSVLTINYPPRVRVPVRSERVGNWPNDSFAWVKRLMRESAARTVVSPEILTYHSYVLGDTEMPGEGELTRNLDVVENIIVFLMRTLGLRRLSSNCARVRASARFHFRNITRSWPSTTTDGTAHCFPATLRSSPMSVMMAHNRWSFSKRMFDSEKACSYDSGIAHLLQ